MVTIMDYEKKYNEALNRAKLLKYNPKKVLIECENIPVSDYIFPELKESKDEKIGKEIITHCRNIRCVTVEKAERIAKWIEWLEKQIKKLQGNSDIGVNKEEKVDNANKVEPFNKYEGLTDFERTLADICIGWIGEEPGWKQYIKDNADVLLKIAIKKLHSVQDVPFERKSVENAEPKFHVGDIVQYITDSTDRRKIEEVDTFCNMYHTDSSPIMFEIEDEWKVVVNAEDVEQNPTDKIEPKFKVGDWVVFDNRHQSIYQVEKIEDRYYILRHTHGRTFRVCVLHDESLRLWTVEDAEDGDVLYINNTMSESIMIYKSFNNGIINKYASYSKFGFEGENYLTLNDGYITPATKEQCDLLFAKMKEAGYELDSEKKELIRIE